MIRSFRGKLTEDLFFDLHTAATRKFPVDLRDVARRKLGYIDAAAQLADLRVPPGNRLEALKGDLRGYHSIRVNDQWRVVFRWIEGAHEVEIADYH